MDKLDVLDTHCRTLARDGVVIIENALSNSELEYLYQKYSSGWNEILDNFSNLQWREIHFNPDCQINTGFIGKDLYDRHHIAEYKSTSILDMSNNRFDFTYGLTDIKLQSTDVNYIMKKMLKNEYNYYLGGLPMLDNSIIHNNRSHIYTNTSNNIRNGKWHRDAYSLFDNEALDMILPPFYYTILIPLFTMQTSSGRNTEFIPGSHCINLAERKIKNADELSIWCNKQPTIKLNCKPGDICIFHGYTIHRGIESNIANVDADNNEQSNLLYAVYKKNWYNDEPMDNYLVQ